jgi:hypothetical protein
MKEIVDVSLRIKSILDDMEEMLQDEHNQVGLEKRSNGELTSDSSDSSDDDDNNASSLTLKRSSSPYKVKLESILNRYELMLKRHTDGNSSNTALHEAFNSVIQNLQMLSLPIASLTERLPRVETDELLDEESKRVRDKLVTLLAKVKEMKDQREELAKRFTQSLQSDDLTREIASHQNEIAAENGGHEQFFKEQLKKARTTDHIFAAKSASPR